MKISNFHHLCIQTEDYKESLKFYTELLGFDILIENENFHGREYNTWLQAANVMIELQTPKSGTSFHPWSDLNGGPVHICFVVEDVKNAYQKLKDAGYTKFKVKNGEELYEVKGKNAVIFKVRAPEGTEIEIRENPGIE